MAGLVWDQSPEDMLVGLVDQYSQDIRQSIRELIDFYAAEIEAWMKENAVWTDQTGNARQTLSTEVEQISNDMVEIILSGGVDYFIYLELANQGRFAIIGPALDTFLPRLWDDIRSLLS